MVERETLDKIQSVENKYGLILFRTGLTHLIDVGARHMDDENVAECIAQIEAAAAEEKANNVHAIMTPAFRMDIVRCAAELAKFSIWELIAYIKAYVAVDIEGEEEE